MNNIKYYMKRVDIANQSTMDLERDFPGMLYSTSKGFWSRGETNVVIEKFADGEDEVYIPSYMKNKSINATLVFEFTGESRHDTMRRFNGYIQSGVIKFWDSKRSVDITFVMKDKIEPSDEKWYGSIPYIEVPYKIINLKGKTETHTA